MELLTSSTSPCLDYYHHKLPNVCFLNRVDEHVTRQQKTLARAVQLDAAS